MESAKSLYTVEARRLSRNPVPVHQGFWRLRMADFPINYVEQRKHIVDPYTTDAPEVKNAVIKDFVCDGLSCSLEKEGHYKFVTYIPTQEDNQYDSTFTINMLADNHYENYWAINRYMETVQSGQTGGDPVRDPMHRVFGLDQRYRNRLTYIPWIDMHAGDDVAQEFMIVRFERCRFIALSPLHITPGALNPISFNVTVKYEIRRIIRLPDPNELMSAICVATSSNAYDNK